MGKGRETDTPSFLPGLTPLDGSNALSNNFPLSTFRPKSVHDHHHNHYHRGEFNPPLTNRAADLTRLTTVIKFSE